MRDAIVIVSVLVVAMIAGLVWVTIGSSNAQYPRIEGNQNNRLMEATR